MEREIEDEEEEECPSNVLPGSPWPPLSSSSALPCASPSPPGANKEEAAWVTLVATATLVTMTTATTPK